MKFEETLAYLPLQEKEALLQAMEEEPVHGLIINQEKLSPESLLSLHPELAPHPFVTGAYIYKEGGYRFGKGLLFDLGAIYIQDPASMMPSYFLDPKPGERILDLCAAPGGKSVDMALSLKGTGTVLANDISYARAKVLSQNIERMGLGNVIVSSNDFSFCYEHYLESFDAIMLDAPCSGSAMFRRSEAVREDWTGQKLEKCLKAQSELLDLAAKMLVPDGRILYSTCSFSFEEDEATVLSFLKRHQDFKPVPLPESPMFYSSSELKEAIHLFPHRFPGEGQFLCLLQKDGTKPYRGEAKMPPCPRKYECFVEEYGLKGRSNEIKREKFYSLNLPFDSTHLNTLRYGVKCFEVRDIFLPETHLARFLPSSMAFEIEEEEARRYLRGETFQTSIRDGFALLSFKGLTMGWAKVVKGVAKNHYPKGLRRDYPKDWL